MQAAEFERRKLCATLLAKVALETRAEFWDWDEDVELIGVAKLVVLLG